MRSLFHFSKISSLLFCLALFHLGKAQPVSVTDSLRQVLKTTKADTTRVNTLNTLSWKLKNDGNYKAALESADEALSLSKKINFNRGIADSYGSMGTIHKSNNDYDLALDCYSRSLKLREEINDRKGIASSCNNIGNVFLDIGEHDKALEFHLRALKIREEIGDNKGIVSSCNNIGNILREKGNYVKALDFCSRSLKILESNGDKIELANCYNSIGIIYNDKGDFDKALNFYLKSLKINEELESKNGMAGCYNNVGMIYHTKTNYDKALEFYFKALKINEELGNKDLMVINYNNIGIIYKEKANYDKAMEFHFIALRISKQIDDKSGMADSYINIANIYQEKNDYQKSLDFYSNALQLLEEIGDKNGMANTYVNIGLLKMGLKKHEEARQWMLKGMQVSKEIGAKDWLMNSYNVLSQLDSTLGDWKGAYEYHKLYSLIKDSVFNAESDKNITEMQTLYETEKKELQIENLNKDNKVKSTEIKRQNTQKIAFAIGFGLMIVLAFVIHRGYRQKQKANEVIYAQKAEVEKQKKVVEEKNTEILESIRYAKRIQSAILQPERIIKHHLPESFILYKPKDIVAGDFYWLEDAKDNTILFAAADCTGHGVPGALVSVICNNGLNRSVREHGITEPGKILDKTREIVIGEFEKSDDEVKDGMDISLCALQGQKLSWAGANNPLWIVKNNEIIEIKADKQPIGKYAEVKPFSTHSIDVLKGDAIYLFTDGFADQFGGEKGKKFKYAKLKELILGIADKPMNEQKQILSETLDAWKGTLEQVDDITIIGVRIT